MFTLSHARTCCALTLSLSLSGLTHAAFSQVISFGDSLSDTGNTNVLAGGAAAPAALGYFDNNFSNGIVWAEQLAINLGLPAATESLLGGPYATNYAYGAARTTLPGGSGPLTGLIPSTQTQVDTYLMDVTDVADANALYTIWTGGNDVNAFNGGSYNGVDLYNDGLAVADIAGDLLAAGAQHILVVNVPNLGLTPIGQPNAAFAAFLTGQFNTGVNDGLNALASSNVTLLDAFSVLQEIVDNAASYNLFNVEDKCFVLDEVNPANSTTCANPEEYLFWDDLHPTAAGHQIMAEFATAQVVPVPAALPLLLSALAGLGFAKRARKS